MTTSQQTPPPDGLAATDGSVTRCPMCGGCGMLPGTKPDDDIMNTPCSECNQWAKSVALCISMCGTRGKHAAKWLLKGETYFPMCDRARTSLMNPPKEYRPGLSADDFTPLNV